MEPITREDPNLPVQTPVRFMEHIDVCAGETLTSRETSQDKHFALLLLYPDEVREDALIWEQQLMHLPQL